MKTLKLLVASLCISSFAMAQEIIKPEESNDSNLDMEMPIRTFWNDWSLSARLEHYVIFGDVIGMADVFQEDDWNLYQDLTKTNRSVDLGVGFRAGKAVNRYFDIGFELAFGSFSGVKEIDGSKNYAIAYSEANMIRYGADVRWNFSKYIVNSEKPKVLAYLAGNASATTNSGEIQRIFHKDIVNPLPKANAETKDYSSTSFLLGLGGGFEFLLTEKLSIDLGSRFYFALGDKLDGLHADEGFDNPNANGEGGGNPHNKNNDFLWNNYLGLTYDFSTNVVNSLSNKWHKGTLLEDMGNDTTEIVIDEDASRVDTVYIKETIIERPVEVVKVKTIVDYNHVSFNPVYFDLDKHSIREDQFASIEAVANFLRKHPEAIVELEGNTDVSASEEYNLKLSERRVQSVRKVLQERYSISADRIKVKYNGEEKPKYKLPALNRRVDFNMESTKEPTK